MQQQLPFKTFMKTRRLTIFLSVFISICATAAAKREEHVVSTSRPVHYDVAITLNDQLSEVTHARTTVSLLVLKENLDVIDMDFGDMAIDSVKLDGHDVTIERAPGRLNVHLPPNTKRNQNFSITVEYHGRPKDGLVLGPDKDARPSATGDNWPNRVHHWIPCLDHPSAKASVRFTVTAPARELVVANGKLEQVTNSPTTARTWTYN